jgi:SIR2-like domain
MSGITIAELALRLLEGELVPYLGPGVLNGVRHRATGVEIPADSDSLILAMHNGRPVSSRLMYEFPRAAMYMELKRGRNAVTRFLTETYGSTDWTRAPLHDWLASVNPPYVVDINRDTRLQDAWSVTPHTLIRGISRIAGTDYRFRIHAHDGNGYHEVSQEQVDPSLPVLFKPMGRPLPDPVYIASDADYVDYITELMGGFAIPNFLKTRRKGLQYLLLGMRLNRDTERMVLVDIIHAAGTTGGWALIPDPTGKEHRFCKRLGIEIIEADIDELLACDRDSDALLERVNTVGC